MGPVCFLFLLLINLGDENSKIAFGVSVGLSLLCIVFVILVVYCSYMNSDSQSYRDLPTVTTVVIDGNDRETIDKCPVFVYSELEENVLMEECTVCLTEFKERDMVKILPECEHIFHKDCIDAWLPFHMDCPICREKVTCNNIDGINNVNVPMEREEDEVLGTEPDLTMMTTEQLELDAVVGPEEEDVVRELNIRHVYYDSVIA